MVLRNNMRELEVLIEFSASKNRSNKKSNMCDDIELFIEYDIEEVKYSGGTYRQIF